MVETAWNICNKKGAKGIGDPLKYVFLREVQKNLLVL